MRISWPSSDLTDLIRGRCIRDFSHTSHYHNLSIKTLLPSCCATAKIRTPPPPLRSISFGHISGREY
ncbi:hypothetical protein HanPI659440_Chr09g0350151 [Helianthus annuus]|nr:hypothetical protein HanPI659440_Chr09g0350151 [Helianthus annuus]